MKAYVAHFGNGGFVWHVYQAYQWERHDLYIMLTVVLWNLTHVQTFDWDLPSELASHGKPSW